MLPNYDKGLGFRKLRASRDSSYLSLKRDWGGAGLGLAFTCDPQTATLGERNLLCVLQVGFRVQGLGRLQGFESY